MDNSHNNEEYFNAANSLLKGVVEMLGNNPYTLETAWACISTYSNKYRCISPLKSIYDAYIDEYVTINKTISDGRGGFVTIKTHPFKDVDKITVDKSDDSNLGEALINIVESVNNEVRKTTVEQKGDYSPTLLVITDSKPSDMNLYHSAVNKMHLGKFNNVIVCYHSVDRVEYHELTNNVYPIDAGLSELDFNPDYRYRYGKYWGYKEKEDSDIPLTLSLSPSSRS